MARLTQSALPGLAREDSEPKVSKLVRATGPTARRADDPHSTPTMLGTNAA